MGRHAGKGSVTPRAELRDAIFRSGKKQQEIARRIGIHESQLSKIVRGWLDPTPDQKVALARLLREPVDSLFPLEQELAS